MYLPCIVPGKDRPDYLATVDVDPESATYSQVTIVLNPRLDATGTGPGVGDWDLAWGLGMGIGNWELGIGNGKWENGKWKWENGK